MPIKLTIEAGQSAIQLAEQHGFFAPTVWDHPDNAALRAKRSNMNILFPGDELTIPDKRAKTEKLATGRAYQFKRKGVPAMFRLQLFDVDTPRARQEYTMTVDGQERRGVTDDQGTLNEFVSPQAKQVHLVIGPDDFEVSFDIGHMDPINEPTGVQKRLQNLGYLHDDADGNVDGEPTRAALRALQRAHKLEETGRADDATLKKLEELHDSVADGAAKP